MEDLKEETNRILAVKAKATKAPWKKRQHPTGDASECFVEGPRPEGMPYACEILGDDYTGFGGNEQRMYDAEFIAEIHNMTSHIKRLQDKIDSLTE